MATQGCWVQFWSLENYNGKTKSFDGPTEIRVLDDVYWNDTEDSIGDDSKSLKTGPNSWLEVFEDENFRDQYRRFYPNSEIADLDDHGFGNEIDSFKLFDSKPAGW